MNKLWILISAMVFIPAFSYAEEKQEEECDQAIIDTGVELTESYDQVHAALSEKQAYEKVREAYFQACKALPEYEPYRQAKEAYFQASKSLPEYAAKKKAWQA